jgi:hypothetical protein
MYDGAAIKKFNRGDVDLKEIRESTIESAIEKVEVS